MSTTVIRPLSTAGSVGTAISVCCCRAWRQRTVKEMSPPRVVWREVLAYMSCSSSSLTDRGGFLSLRRYEKVVGAAEECSSVPGLAGRAGEEAERAGLAPVVQAVPHVGGKRFEQPAAVRSQNVPEIFRKIEMESSGSSSSSKNVTGLTSTGQRSRGCVPLMARKQKQHERSRMHSSVFFIFIQVKLWS